MHSTASSNTLNSTRLQGALIWLIRSRQEKKRPSNCHISRGLGEGQGAMTSRIITLAVAASAFAVAASASARSCSASCQHFKCCQKQLQGLYNMKLCMYIYIYI